MLVAALVVPGHRRVETVASSGSNYTTPGLAANATATAGGTPGGAAIAGSAGLPGGGLNAPSTAGTSPGAGSSAGGGSLASGPSTGGASTGGGSTGAASASTPTGPVRGVTNNSVTIGIAYLDLGPVAYLGPQYDIGNVPEQWNALIDGWRRQGLLPVNGRDIKLVFQSFNVLDTTQQEAACTALVQDHGAFAVVAPQFFYQYGDQCVTQQMHTPLITSDGAPDSVYSAGDPNLFTAMTSTDNLIWNFVYWAQARGALRGHKIGIYHLDDATDQRLVNDDLKPALAKLGYSLAAEATTNSANGGPDDALAVERFRAAGVDLAILMTSNLGFQEQAEAQNYSPTYLDNDYNGDTTYLGANDYPPQEYNGTYAVTEQRHGEWSAGMPTPPQDGPCLANYERYSGQTIQPADERTGAWVYVMLSCDLGSMLLHGLQSAGRNLTPASFIGGVEAMENAPMTTFPNITYGPVDHEGVHQQRTIQWEANCKCWVARGSFSPLLVQSAPSG